MNDPATAPTTLTPPRATGRLMPAATPHARTPGAFEVFERLLRVVAQLSVVKILAAWSRGLAVEWHLASDDERLLSPWIGSVDARRGTGLFLTVEELERDGAIPPGGLRANHRDAMRLLTTTGHGRVASTTLATLARVLASAPVWVTFLCEGDDVTVDGDELARTVEKLLARGIDPDAEVWVYDRDAGRLAGREYVVALDGPGFLAWFTPERGLGDHALADAACVELAVTEGPLRVEAWPGADVCDDIARPVRVTTAGLRLADGETGIARVFA